MQAAAKAQAGEKDPTKEKKDGEESDEEEDEDHAKFLESVTKDEWKTIEASLSYQKKKVAEMLKAACAQVRTKGELSLDDSNGKFLGDMLPEMEQFAMWCYREHVRPKLIALPLALPEEAEEEPEKGKGGKGKGGGGGKKGGGGGGKGKGGGKGGGKDAIPAKVQIKIDNVMRIMAGESAKDKGKKGGVQVGDRAVGWLEALEPGKMLVLDAPWELQASPYEEGAREDARCRAEGADALACPRRSSLHTSSAHSSPRRWGRRRLCSTRRRATTRRRSGTFPGSFRIRAPLPPPPLLLLLAERLPRMAGTATCGTSPTPSSSSRRSGSCATPATRLRCSC
jgi:hypothetical protein